MTSPFELAEFVGGPIDGRLYERTGPRFPTQLSIPFNGYVYLYQASMGRLGQVVYRYAGPIAVEVVR